MIKPEMSLRLDKIIPGYKVTTITAKVNEISLILDRLVNDEGWDPVFITTHDPLIHLGPNEEAPDYPIGPNAVTTVTLQRSLFGRFRTSWLRLTDSVARRLLKIIEI